jgi:membrane protease YdiL (CAAX protease family)
MKTILKDYFDNQRNGINGVKLTILMVLFFFFMFFQIIFLEEVQFLNNIDEFINVFFSFPTFPIFGAFNSFLFVVMLLWFFGYSFPRCETINKNNKISFQLIISISLILLFFTFLLYDYNREGNLKFGNVVLYFLAAASEEIINRVFILGNMIFVLRKNKMKNYIWISVILSSLFFLVCHIPYTLMIGKANIVNYFSIFSFGILTSWIYIKTSNLYLVVFLHFVCNLLLLELHFVDGLNLLFEVFIQIFMIFLAVKGKNILDRNQ